MGHAELVDDQAGENPWIKVVIHPDDIISVSAYRVPQQNVIPILARMVKAYASAPERSFEPYSEPGPWPQDGVPLP